MPLPANSISIPTFSPRIGIITAITRANGATIQTSLPITFVVGQSVRIIIPPPARATMTSPAYNYGMPEINEMLATVVFVNPALPNFFRTDIDSRFFQPFTYQPNATQLAQAVPVGELNSHLDGAWRNILGPV
ncbi:hypothetical protein [Methylobacter sp.]|uniref:hypothetical protein n=1 Tax=Methylobacter sp. TaxID=2051955 RepID=UPI003DA46873